MSTVITKKVTATALLLLSLSPFMAKAQGDSAPAHDVIAWNQFYDLQWHDFQGEPGDEARGDAGASVRIVAKPFLVKKKLAYEVTAQFNRKKSWSRDQSEALLAHEQLHFDLAELYARKIRKKIASLSREGVNDVKVINAAIRVILEESNRADEQYDAETLHGALTRKQDAWNQKVQEELAALDRYKKVRRIIKAG